MDIRISKFYQINKIFKIVLDLSQKVAYNTHHLDHIVRVLKICQKIACLEKANQLIVEAAACMHDIGRFYEDPEDMHEKISANKAREILKDFKWKTEEVEKVVYAIEVHRFSKQVIPNSLEAKILQDADKIDALGAIGIIRVVNHKPDLQLYKLFKNNQAENKDNKYVLDHFEEKILKLPYQLHTRSAKQIAKQRFEFTRKFLEQLQKEIKF